MAKKTEASKTKISAIGWRVPDNIQEEFRAWCDSHQRKYEGELAKALFLWTREGSMIRDWVELAMTGDLELGPAFWEAFQEKCDATARELRRQLREEAASRSTQ